MQHVRRAAFALGRWAASTPKAGPVRLAAWDLSVWTCVRIDRAARRAAGRAS